MESAKVVKPHFAVWPSADSPVSLGTWSREIAALARISVAPPPFPTDAKRGCGQPVLVVPGFCSLDISTARLREFLTLQGFSAQPSRCGINLGPTRVLLDGLEQELDKMSVQYGGSVSLVGISLGGTIAREIAKRCPELVARVITVVSPIRLPVATPLSPLAQMAAMMWGDDAWTALARIAEPPPVELTAIVNPKDGVVDWQACMPDASPNVETVLIDGSHMTMASNPETQRIIAERLAQTS